MGKNDGRQYWDERSAAAYEYRGERFYTITPIAYYYQRRQRIFEQIEAALVRFPHNARVLDYGCGDGAYLRILTERNKGEYFGCDISAGMIMRAQEECENVAAFSIMQPAQIPFAATFDCIYCSAVLAHILDDEMLIEALQDVRAHLAPGGVFCIAEATAWWRRSGRTWVRRKPSEYSRILSACGFRVINQHTIAYPLFFWYENILLPIVRSIVFRGTREARMLAVNRSPAIRACNEAVMCLARYLSLPCLTPTHTTIITAIPKD